MLVGAHKRVFFEKCLETIPKAPGLFPKRRRAAHVRPGAHLGAPENIFEAMGQRLATTYYQIIYVARWFSAPYSVSLYANQASKQARQTS